MREPVRVRIVSSLVPLQRNKEQEAGLLVVMVVVRCAAIIVRPRRDCPVLGLNINRVLSRNEEVPVSPVGLV